MSGWSRYGIFLVMLATVPASSAQSQSALDSLGITVSGTSREFAYTNKETAVLYGETNDSFRPGWQGFTVFGHRFLDDYLLTADGRRLDRAAAVTTVYPDYLRRSYPGGIVEEVHPLDSLPCFALVVTSPSPIEIGIIPLRSDGRAPDDFETHLGPARASIARRAHLRRSVGENYPVWLTLYAPGSAPLATSTHHGARFGPVAFASGRTRSCTMLFAVGDEREGTELTAVGAERRLDALAAGRRRRMEQFLAASEVRTGNARFDRALAWARLSIDGLIMNQVTTGIFAGLPWFNNYWGRDTFVALPGAALVTGQFRTAKKILRSFAHLQERDSLSRDWGRIPNLVTTTDKAYNTADGTPRFVTMIRDYIERSGDSLFLLEMYPTVLRAMEGTIRMHTDSLGFLTHGDAETWMDAVGPDGPWSPRGNRANDIQALWAAQLEAGISMATRLGDVASARDWAGRLLRLKRNFTRMFVTHAGIADRLTAEGRRDMRIRPNQIFTAPLLDEVTRGRMVRTVTSELVYPWGVASLAQGDSLFRAYHQEPSLYPKDAAYHNGTVWTWLQGPLISEYCRLKRQDLAFMLTQNSIHQILDRGAVGTQSELLDAFPHPGDAEPRLSGTFSQAWNLAEFVRNFFDDYLGVRYNRSTRTLSVAPRLPRALGSVSARVNLDGQGFTVAIAGHGDTQEVTISTMDFRDTMNATIVFSVGGQRRAQLQVIPGGATVITLRPGSLSAIREGMSVPVTQAVMSEPHGDMMPETAPFAVPGGQARQRALTLPGHRLLRGDEVLRPGRPTALVADVTDPAFDDTGSGRFTYPLNPHFVPGSFDIRRFTLETDSNSVTFTLHFRALSDPGWHPEYGFQLTFVAIAVDRDGVTGSGSTVIGRNAQCTLSDNHGFEAIIYCGGGFLVQDMAGRILASYTPEEGSLRHTMGNVDDGTVKFSIPRSILGTPGPGWTFTVLAGGQDDHGGSGLGEFRTVLPARGEWNGGGKTDPAASNVYDTVTTTLHR